MFPPPQVYLYRNFLLFRGRLEAVENEGCVRHGSGGYLKPEFCSDNNKALCEGGDRAYGSLERDKTLNLNHPFQSFIQSVP